MEHYDRDLKFCTKKTEEFLEKHLEDIKNISNRKHEKFEKTEQHVAELAINNCLDHLIVKGKNHQKIR